MASDAARYFVQDLEAFVESKIDEATRGDVASRMRLKVDRESLEMAVDELLQVAITHLLNNQILYSTPQNRIN